MDTEKQKALRQARSAAHYAFLPPPPPPIRVGERVLTIHEIGPLFGHGRMLPPGVEGVVADLMAPDGFAVDTEYGLLYIEERDLIPVRTERPPSHPDLLSQVRHLIGGGVHSVVQDGTGPVRVYDTFTVLDDETPAEVAWDRYCSLSGMLREVGLEAREYWADANSLGFEVHRL